MAYLRIKTPRTFQPGDRILGRLGQRKRDVPLTVKTTPRIEKAMRMVPVMTEEKYPNSVYCSVASTYVVESVR